MMLHKLMFILTASLLANCSGLKSEDIVLDTPKDIDRVKSERNGKLFGDLEYSFPSSDKPTEPKPSEQENAKKEEAKK